MKRLIVSALAGVTALVLHRAALAVQVLQPGYMVETYASYSCPVASEAFGMPRGLTFAPDGSLYLTQLRSYPDKGTVYRVSPAGFGVEWLTSFGTPRRIAWAGGSAYGNYLYLTDGTSNAVFRVGLDGSVSVFASVSGGVHSLGLDRQGLYGGLLYVATRAPDQIRAVSVSGQVTLFSTFPGNVPGGYLDLTFDPGTNWGQLMYVALERPSGQTGVGGVFRVDADGQATAVAASIVTAWTVAIAPAGPNYGDMYVCGKLRDDDPSYSLWRVKPDGSLTQFAVPTLGSNLQNLAFASDGTLFVPEFSFADQTVIISRISASTGAQAPSLLVEPADQTVCLGQFAQFSAVVQGTPPFSYQWQFQGTNLLNATDAWLALAAAQFSDAGGYRLVASNAFGAVTSRVATLTVVGCPPSIGREPFSQSVELGSPATFDVIVEGSPPFAYQWRFKGTNLPGATEARLALAAVQFSDAGGYQLEASSAFGAVTSRVATLTVVGNPPFFSRYPVSQSAVVGWPARFDAAVGGSPPLWCQWQFNGVALVGATNAIFSLGSVLPAHAGDYRLIVTNAFGSASSPVARLALVPMHTGPGALDLTFHADASPFVYSESSAYSPVNALALDAQGGVYVAGAFTLAGDQPASGVARLLADGTWDRTFQSPWSGQWCSALAMQPNQHLLVAGEPPYSGSSRLSRLKPDGSLDESFTCATEAGGVVLQPDGRILAFERLSAMRLFSDGSRDWSFSPNFGSADETSLTELALQPNGGILVCGSSDIGLRRYYPEGSQDYGFNSEGIHDAKLRVQPDSRILVGRQGSLARLNAYGGWDGTFTTASLPGYPQGLAMQPDGRILVAVIRTEPNGAIIHPESVEIYRFNANGARDYTFLATLACSYGLEVNSMLVQPDGRILIGGKFCCVNGLPANNLARLNGEYLPVLRALGLPGPAGFPIELAGGPSQRYAVEISSNLAAWSVACYVTNSATGTCCFTNAPAPLASQRFYRAKRNP